MSDNQPKINLLVVDDEKDFLSTLSERLRHKNFEVTAASQGETAIKAAKKAKFDVALVDLRMPEMDGVKLLQILKKKHKFLEVIILTGYGEIDSAIEATKLGAYSYLEKPFEYEKLVEVLQNAYQSKLSKKSEYEKRRIEELQMLSMGTSPMGILKTIIRARQNNRVN